MAFADTLGAVATIINMPRENWTTTIESKTNFISPAPSGTKLTGRMTALHKGRRTQVWETAITREDGKLVAKVTQTQLVLKRDRRQNSGNGDDHERLHDRPQQQFPPQDGGGMALGA